MPEPRRVVVVHTHPVQYLAPWYRWIADREPSIALTVLYAVEPTPQAQAVGFGGAFTWDVPLREGYTNRVLADVPSAGRLDAAGFSIVDAPRLESALAESRPDAILVPGWHAAVYRRALDVCRRRGWPVVYRGDSTLASGRRWVPRLVRTVATRWRLARFDAYLAVGQRSREYLLAHGVVEPLVFESPHAVDADWFAERAAGARAPERRRAIQERFGLDPAACTLLFAGKLQSRKRPLDVIRAASALGRGVQVLVAGAGPLEAACRREAARLNVTARFAGFLNQREMVHAYAAADMLVLPSEGETWGLVVNEALASGVPCVVSDGVGCQPDLVGTDATGASFAAGDVPALADAVRGVRDRLASGYPFETTCAAASRSRSFEAATIGLTRALARLERRRAARDRETSGVCLVACCGGMTRPGGLERMTFEVLRVARHHGARVHCVVNTWGSRAIVDLADEIGASWSTGFYWYRIERRVWRPMVAARLLWDVTATSAGLLRDAVRHRATTILLPDHSTVLRNLPALWLLRLAGVRVVHRLGTAPEEGAGYRLLWRWLVTPASHELVCNSSFTARELRRTGVGARKVRVAKNVLPGRRPPITSTPEPGRIVYAGQIIPGKGVHLLIDAIARLVPEGFQPTLDILGDIDGWESPSWAGYRRRLVAQASQPALQGRVRFLGWRDDVPAALASAWLHVAPSLPELREAFGVVVLEAKAAGVPSIVCPSGALPDLVEHGVDGWLAREASAEALAEGIRYFLADAGRRRLASSAARESLGRHSPEAFAREWIEAFAWGGALGAVVERPTCG